MAPRSYSQREDKVALFLGSFFMLPGFAADAIKTKSQFVEQEGQLVAGQHLHCEINLPQPVEAKIRI